MCCQDPPGSLGIAVLAPQLLAGWLWPLSSGTFLEMPSAKEVTFPGSHFLLGFNPHLCLCGYMKGFEELTKCQSSLWDQGGPVTIFSPFIDSLCPVLLPSQPHTLRALPKRPVTNLSLKGYVTEIVPKLETNFHVNTLLSHS